MQDLPDPVSREPIHTPRDHDPGIPSRRRPVGPGGRTGRHENLRYSDQWRPLSRSRRAPPPNAHPPHDQRRADRSGCGGGHAQHALRRMLAGGRALRWPGRCHDRARLAQTGRRRHGRRAWLHAPTRTARGDGDCCFPDCSRLSAPSTAPTRRAACRCHRTRSPDGQMRELGFRRSCHRTRCATVHRLSPKSASALRRRQARRRAPQWRRRPAG